MVLDRAGDDIERFKVGLPDFFVPLFVFKCLTSIIDVTIYGAALAVYNIDRILLEHSVYEEIVIARIIPTYRKVTIYVEYKGLQLTAKAWSSKDDLER